MHEKDELYIDQEVEPISLQSFLVVLVAIFVCLLLIMPKIYIANNIYYKSVEIRKNKNTLLILEDEHEVLRQKLQSVKFKMENQANE